MKMKMVVASVSLLLASGIAYGGKAVKSAISVTNNSSIVISFQLQNGNNLSWESITLNPGQTGTMNLYPGNMVGARVINTSTNKTVSSSLAQNPFMKSFSRGTYNKVTIGSDYSISGSN
jgi:hypothetical protein